MFSDNLMANIHKVYRNDELIKQLLKGAGFALDDWESTRDDLVNQYDFEKMTWGISLWENLLSIKTDSNKPIEDRRSAISARWKSNGKSDLVLIQAIANGWKNGEVQVSFIDGNIKLSFNSLYGVPNDLQGLLDAVDNVKPAHLAVVYVLKYLLIKDIHNVMTLGELEQQPLSRFAF